jgi:hypothetical protein
MGGGALAADALAQLTVAGVLAGALATTLPSIPTRLTVYVLVLCDGLVLSGLMSTPSGLLTAPGVGLLDSLGGEELVRDELAGVGGLAAPAPNGPQAPASSAAANTSATESHGVLISKGNGTLRGGLRFRYDPATEAGHRPSPPGLRSKGSRLRRMASGYPFCFIYSNWRNSRNLNLLEVASHLV